MYLLILSLIKCFNGNQKDEYEERYDGDNIPEGKGEHLNNHRPIYLLLNICKVMTKILMKRLEKTLDEKQPREQVGFRSGYSTTDYINNVNQLKEKYVY